MTLLARPGEPGGFGALMDEYARAAEDLCRVVEALDPDAFTAERESDDPDCVTPMSIVEHCVRACFGYALDIRRARGLPTPEPEIEPVVPTPTDFRKALAAGLRYTEGALEGFYDATDEEILGLEFRVSWGATYNAESILEHGIVHLLRHRRQLERW